MAGDYFSSDTIAAIATSLAGDGGVGIIRLSGPKAIDCASAITTGLDEAKPRFLSRIEVRDPSTGQTLDDGLGAYFPEGQSFTGEAVVELQLHGGRFLLQTILQLLLATGQCRLALPGEFSFRAVRNGKLSLSGAAAVGQLVAARSLFEVQAARKAIGQTRLKEIDEIAEKLRNLVAQMELSIDFIDQDVEVISEKQLKAELATILATSERLLAQLKAAQRIARGLSVTLLGVPNAGKSTLFNALLAEERAIVSPEAGTTRDVITEEIRLGPYHLRLADTAGVRDALGTIEAEGIARAKDLAAAADLVLLVIDSTLSDDEIGHQVESVSSRGDAITVLNKWDMISKERQSAVRAAVGAKAKGVIESVSAKSGEGIERLLACMKDVLDRKFGLGVNCFLPTEFQLQMLLECQGQLKQSIGLVQGAGLTHPELLSTALRGAVKALSDLVGETTPDSVLAKIFSEFCIGK